MTFLGVAEFIIFVLWQKSIEFILNCRQLLNHRVLLCLYIVQFFDIISVLGEQGLRLILHSFNRLDLSEDLHLVLREVACSIIKLLLVSYKLIVPSRPDCAERILTKLFMPLIELGRSLVLLRLLLRLSLILFLLILGLLQLLLFIYERCGFGCLSCRCPCTFFL